MENSCPEELPGAMANFVLIKRIKTQHKKNTTQKYCEATELLVLFVTADNLAYPDQHLTVI